MPVGPFKTFDECVEAQKAKGQDDESAGKICGEIEKRTNQSVKEGVRNAQLFDRFDRCSREWVPVIIQ
jgi:hypothetical protein